MFSNVVIASGYGILWMVFALNAPSVYSESWRVTSYRCGIVVVAGVAGFCAWQYELTSIVMVIPWVALGYLYVSLCFQWPSFVPKGCPYATFAVRATKTTSVPARKLFHQHQRAVAKPTLIVDNTQAGR